jgi:hypothetical protein
MSAICEGDGAWDIGYAGAIRPPDPLKSICPLT